MNKFGEYKECVFDITYSDKVYKIDHTDIVTKNTAVSNEINLVKELQKLDTEKMKDQRNKKRLEESKMGLIPGAKKEKKETKLA